MKKRTVLILTLISIVAMVAGTAMAPLTGRSIRFMGAQFTPGKGAVFLFEYTGKITKSELNAVFAYGNGGDPLNAHCVDKKELSQIRCTVSNVNQYNEVMLSIIGQGFWANVPERVGPCLGFIITDANWTLVEYIPWTAPRLPSGYTHEDHLADWEAGGFIVVNRCVRDTTWVTITTLR